MFTITVPTPVFGDVRVTIHVAKPNLWKAEVATHQLVKRFHDSAVSDQLVEFGHAGQDIVIDGLVMAIVKPESLFFHPVAIKKIDINRPPPGQSIFYPARHNHFLEKTGNLLPSLTLPTESLRSIDKDNEEYNCEISATLKYIPTKIIASSI